MWLNIRTEQRILQDYGSRHLTKKHDDVPVVKCVNELEDGLQTCKKGNGYLCKVTKEDDDYMFLKEVIEGNLWKEYGKDP